VAVCWVTTDIGMGWVGSTDAEGGAFESDGESCFGGVFVPGLAVGHHVGFDAEIHQGRADEGPVFAQKGFTSGQREMSAFQFREVFAKFQSLGRSQLVGAFPSGS